MKKQTTKKISWEAQSAQKDSYLHELWRNARYGGKPNSQLSNWTEEEWVKAVKLLLSQSRQDLIKEIGEFIGKMKCHSVPEDHSDSNGFCHYGSACGDIDRFLENFSAKQKKQNGKRGEQA